MSNTIQSSYGTQPYGIPTKARATKQAGTQVNSFLNLAVQASQSRTDTSITGMSGLMGVAALPTSLMMDLSALSANRIQASGVEATEALSLEEMLKAKYPNLHYHVFDASSGHWKTRNDYPHYLLYQDGDKAKETLENWQPEGANPFYGSKEGRFIAPKEIHALSSVPPGSKAVVIHPKVQERMEQDPTYAQEILRRSTLGLPLTWHGTKPLCRDAQPVCPRLLPLVRTGISATPVLPVAAVRLPTPRAALTMKKAGGICVWPATPSL